VFKSPLGHEPFSDAGRHEPGFGPYDLVLWPIGQFNPEVLVKLCFVLGIGVAEGGEDVSGLVDEGADLLPSKACASACPLQFSLCGRSLGLGLSDPVGDDRWVGTLGEGFKHRAVCVQLPVALSDLLPGVGGSGVVSGVLRLVELVDEPREVAGVNFLLSQRSSSGTMASSRR
jgi:hypothetical protein